MGIRIELRLDQAVQVPMGIPAVGSLSEALADLRTALAITPIDSPADVRLRFAPVEPASSQELTCWSDGWTVWINNKPDALWGDRNPLTAAVAGACAAIAAEAAASGASVASYVLSLTDYSETPQRGELSTLDVTPFVLAGAGSIGSAFTLAFAGLSLRGRAVVADRQKLSRTNLKRYVAATPADLGTAKAALAARMLTARGLDVDGREIHAGAALQNLPSHYLLITALDTAIARRGLAEDLPAEVLDAAVDANDERIELLHASFPPSGACLACFYPREGRQSLYEHMASDFGMSVGRLLQLLQENYCIDRDFMAQVCEATGRVLPDSVLGESIDTAWRGFCAAGHDGTPEHRKQRDLTQNPRGAAVPALAGALLAVELAKRCRGLPTVENFFTWSVRAAPNPEAHRYVRANSQCTVCGDADFSEIYARKHAKASEPRRI